MIDAMTPAAIFFLGALLTPFLRTWPRRILLLIVPVIGLWQLFALSPVNAGYIDFLDYRLITLRIDTLSLVFGAIFHIAAFIVALYSLHVRDTMQHVAMLVTAGAAIGAVLAGDLITLFVFWELTAIASVFLIWARRTGRSYAAGMRYLLIQMGSGLLLLFGAIMLARETGSVEFRQMQLGSIATWAIFLGFGIKCAFPLLHNWLQDAYPEATVTGTVVLGSFTTKLAIYALARGFAGESLLIPIGALMTAFPIFYAVIENDLRRVLAYSLNNQLGFMVVGIGLGTEMAINGAVAHAVNNILFKGLLFMSIGAVLLRTGTAKGSELGGLYKSMPWTTAFCLVGAASISAFPLFAGFVSKGMILAAAADEGHWFVWLVLLFASAGVFHHSGIKIPYFAFFAHDRGIRCREAPLNMLAAMGITAALCILIGVYPAVLYGMLPYAVTYVPYTVDHVVSQMQLLLFSALAFTLLMRSGIYPPELRAANLDIDWIYRRMVPRYAVIIGRVYGAVAALISNAGNAMIRQVLNVVYQVHGPQGVLARTPPIGIALLWVAVLLAATLLLYYL
ncbi:MAG: Na(+)/H(+) antiporter subunit D [Alphaproteobacteria bacterium]